MTSAEQQALVYLFVCALPMSLAGWAFCVMGAGCLAHGRGRPALLRVVAHLVPVGDRGRNGAVVALGCVFVGLANFVPLATLFRNPYGQQVLLLTLAYFAVQAGLLVPTAQAVLRARRSGGAT